MKVYKKILKKGKKKESLFLICSFVFNENYDFVSSHNLSRFLEIVL